MPSTVVERFGAVSATSVKKETTFGTAAATAVAGDFTPMTGNSLALNPGLFFPKLMVGQRDQNVFPLYGQFKSTGSLDYVLMPTNAANILPGFIGADAPVGYGVTGTGSTNATTLSGAVSAGATSVTVTSATGYVIGDFIQIDVNNTATPTTSEVRKITNVVTNTISFAEPLGYSHLSGAACKEVTVPFNHTINQTNFTLPSYTVEKNLGGYQSLRFVGSRFSKLDIKCQTTNSAVTVSADCQSKTASVVSSPAPVAYNNESPYTFAEASLSLFGNVVNQATSAALTLNNTLQDTYTMNSSHDLNFLSPISRSIDLKSDVVFTSLDDPAWGYWTLMQNQANLTQAAGAFSLSFTHPNNLGAWTFNCPTCYIKTITESIKIDDVIISSIDMTAALNIATGVTINATHISPSVYTAY